MSSAQNGKIAETRRNKLSQTFPIHYTGDLHEGSLKCRKLQHVTRRGSFVKRWSEYFTSFPTAWLLAVFACRLYCAKLRHAETAHAQNTFPAPAIVIMYLIIRHFNVRTSRTIIRSRGGEIGESGRHCSGRGPPASPEVPEQVRRCSSRRPGVFGVH